MMNEEFARQEWDKASDTLSHLKATQSKLDFKKHCLDFSEGKISVDYFVLLVAWTWNKLAILNGLSGLTHWAYGVVVKIFHYLMTMNTLTSTLEILMN